MFKTLATSTTALFLATQAYAVTIDFDDLANGTFIDTQYESDGVNFSSTGGGVRVFNFSGADTPSNTIGGTDAGGFLDFGQDIILTFVEDGMAAVTDFISVAFTDVQLMGNTLSAFDVDGALLGEVVAPCAVEFSCDLIQTLSLSIDGIHTVVLQGAGGRGQADVAFDTVVFNDVVLADDMAAVPLPAGLPLILSGLGALMVARRRKNA